ncbi:MAG: condensation domain-containing protein, partial [Cytophagales bacterium]|nr:condensation domain-containing protein [Cytophagales bacterium]
QVEGELVRIWQEVLGHERIGINDNFFELGGHSLKATQVISRLYKDLDKKIDLSLLFMHPTIIAFSECLSVNGNASYAKISPIEEQEHYGLSHAQRRLWMTSRMLGANAAYNVLFSYCFVGKLNTKHLESSIRMLLIRHESLRTVFTIIDGEPRQRIKDKITANFTLEYIDLRSNQNAEAQAKDLAHEEMKEEFDISGGPLIRAKILQTGEDKFVFLLTMNHIVCDEWSRAVMIHELLDTYMSYQNGLEATFEPLNLQYKDYAAWQIKQLSGAELNKHQSYWKKKLAGNLPKLELPTDFIRPRMKTYIGEVQENSFNKEITKKIKKVGQSTGATLFITLISTVKILLHRYTEQSDIIIGMPVSAREHIDLENQIGFYTNAVPLRTYLENTDTFEDVLKKVNEVTLEALDHQSYPFDNLVEDLNITRDTSHMPLFDVMVQFITKNNYINSSMPALPQGIEIDFFNVPHTVSKYDLVFSFKEVEEEIAITIEYSTDIFNRQTIIKLLSNYVTLVENLILD